MNNGITDLNNYLFEQLERLQDDECSDEEFEKELKRAAGVKAIAETIIETERLAFQVIKHKDEYGYAKKDISMPGLLEVHS